jgi:hypothetical protein
MNNEITDLVMFNTVFLIIKSVFIVGQLRFLSGNPDSPPGTSDSPSGNPNSLSGNSNSPSGTLDSLSGNPNSSSGDLD